MLESVSRFCTFFKFLSAVVKMEIRVSWHKINYAERIINFITLDVYFVFQYKFQMYYQIQIYYQS